MEFLQVQLYNCEFDRRSNFVVVVVEFTGCQFIDVCMHKCHNIIHFELMNVVFICELF